MKIRWRYFNVKTRLLNRKTLYISSIHIFHHNCSYTSPGMFYVGLRFYHAIKRLYFTSMHNYSYSRENSKSFAGNCRVLSCVKLGKPRHKTLHPALLFSVSRLFARWWKKITIRASFAAQWLIFFFLKINSGLAIFKVQA